MTARTSLDLGFARVGTRPLLDLTAVPWCADEARPRPSIMFPTVVDTKAWPPVANEQPPNRYLLYYAPHHSHGIGVASSPALEGPWTPYAGNPILRLEDVPGLRGHISSPEIVYRPDRPEAPFWLYFHGQALPAGGGQQTCAAESPDGLRWRLLAPEPVLTGTPEQTKEDNTAAYLRVFQRDGWYYGVSKAEKVHGLVRSHDGLRWEHWPRNPLIGPLAAESEYDRIRHTGVVVEGETLFFFYCTLTRADLSCEEIKLATLHLRGGDWLEWGPLRRHGVVFSPALTWERADLRDPFLVRRPSGLFMYYAGGGELGIGLAVAPPDALSKVSGGA